MKTQIKYFHELSAAEWEQIKADGCTWQEVREKYPGPKWCKESAFIVDPLGCWSLIAVGKPYRITEEADCHGCDLYRGREERGNLSDGKEKLAQDSKV